MPQIVKPRVPCFRFLEDGLERPSQRSDETCRAPRIHEELKAEGIQVGKKSIARLLRLAGLQVPLGVADSRPPGWTPPVELTRSARGRALRHRLHFLSRLLYSNWAIMADKSTPPTRTWAIALAVIVCIPGWIAWMDLLHFASPATSVPHLRFTAPTWEYLLVIGGPLAAVALVRGGTSLTYGRAFGVVLGGYAAALCLATFFAFVGNAPHWKTYILSALGLLTITLISTGYSEIHRPTRSGRTWSLRPGPYVADELAKLAALKHSGVLSAEEFAAQKAKLLQ